MRKVFIAVIAVIAATLSQVLLAQDFGRDVLKAAVMQELESAYPDVVLWPSYGNKLEDFAPFSIDVSRSREPPDLVAVNFEESDTKELIYHRIEPGFAQSESTITAYLKPEVGWPF